MKDKSVLREGYTTGTCATAGAVVSAYYLLTGQSLKYVDVFLPKERTLQLPVFQLQSSTQSSSTTIIKDAGDDPDCTHGCKVITRVRLLKEKHFFFRGGTGIGTVTKAGLPLTVGEPAINPTPRQIIQKNLELLSAQYNYKGGFEITISIPNGEILAKKTMCEQLGIMGGLCILGTTGIVKPFSCGAYISSIYQGIDVAHTNGEKWLVLVTGSTSLAYAQQNFGLPKMAIIEVGDFLMAGIKRLRSCNIKRVSVVSAWSKMIKISQGKLNLHSHFSSINRNLLIKCFPDQDAKKIKNANTMLELIELFSAQEKTAICKQAYGVVCNKLPNTTLDIHLVDRQSKGLSFFKQ